MESNFAMDEVAEHHTVCHENDDDDAFIWEEIGDYSDVQQGEPIIVLEPQKGMMFDGEDDAVRFYNSYAKKKGFGVIRRTTRHGEDNKLNYFTLACSRQGKAHYSSKKPNPSTRMQCPSKINFGRRGEKFCVTSVTLDHNHPTSPSKARFVRSYKKLDLDAKRRLELERYDSLCKRSHQVAENGAESDALYALVMDGLNALQIKIDAYRASQGVQNEDPTSNHEDTMLNNEKLVPSPIPVRSVGRPASKRKESKIDEVVKKLRAKKQQVPASTKKVPSQKATKIPAPSVLVGVDELPPSGEMEDTLDFSISRCMAELNGLEGVTPGLKVKCYDVFKCAKNCEIFINAAAAKDDTALAWLQSQIVEQICHGSAS